MFTYIYILYWVGEKERGMEVVGDGVWDLDLYGFSFCGLVLTFSSPFISFHCLVLSCLVSSLLKEIGIRMLCISSHFSLSHHHLPSSLLSSLHPLSCSSTVQVQSRDGRPYKHREIAVDLQLAAYMMHIIYVLLEERSGMEWVRGKILRCNLRGFYVHNYLLLPCSVVC